MDFSDELTLLATRYLKEYKLLIMLRDGMFWPGGYEGSRRPRRAHRQRSSGAPD